MCGKEPKSVYAKELDDAVKAVKKSEEWRREYMTLLMRDKEKIKVGEYTDKIWKVFTYDSETRKVTMINEFQSSYD